MIITTTSIGRVGSSVAAIIAHVSGRGFGCVSKVEGALEHEAIERKEAS